MDLGLALAKETKQLVPSPHTLPPLLPLSTPLRMNHQGDQTNPECAQDLSTEKRPVPCIQSLCITSSRVRYTARERRRPLA